MPSPTGPRPPSDAAGAAADDAAAPPGPPVPLDCGLAEKVLVRFLREELHRTGLRKLVIGVSGGVDSSVAALLAARAIGPENVVGIAMPSAESSPRSLEDAREVAALGGFALDVVEIADAAAGLLRHLGEMSAIRKGNVLARLRMIVLYDRSAAVDGLVVGTSNKSELLLGYGTLHGDLASALNPLGDLWKCQVRALGRHLGCPERLAGKPASPDLWAGQTTEGELGFSYDLADRILHRLVDERLTPEAVIDAGFDERVVRRIETMIVRNQFKRRLPLIAKLSTRTVGWEFRYPRDWRT